MLRDAVMRVNAAAEFAGVRAILVHAIPESARTFYETHGFHRSVAEARKMLEQRTIAATGAPLVRTAGIEPAREAPRDFKSLASTSSATSARSQD